MRLISPPVPLALSMLVGLTACPSSTDPTDTSTVGAEMGSSDSDTGADTGTDTGTDTGGDDDEVDVSGVSLTHLGDEMNSSNLSATVGPAGVSVVHTEIWENCCYMPFVTASAAAPIVTVSYMNNGEICDCECSWEVRYTLGGLEPGTWTIRAGSRSAEVVIE